MKSSRTLTLCIGLIFGLSVVLSACGTATPSYTPVFVEQSCPMEIPADYSVRCGTVTVPEDRLQSKGNQVVLSVAVVEPPGGSTDQPPVIVLTGGPGFGTVSYLQNYLYHYRKIVAERPVIFFDQRGTGLSQPALDCPEILEADSMLYRQALPDDEELKILLDAYAKCKSRLEQSGISLSSYTTAASADDVRDIITALGYPQVYLFGTSYGTELGQVTLLRHQSEGWISGAILDSVVPLQVDLQKEFWTNTQAVFKLLFARCAADPDCNTRYPTLQETFYATLDQLRRSPLEVSTFDPQTGRSMKVKMDDEDFVSILFYSLYNPLQASMLPQTIDRVSKGDTRLLDHLYRNYIGLDYGAYEGMSTSVRCADAGMHPEMEAFHQANATLDPAFQELAKGDAEDVQRICELWDVKPADRKENRAVKTKLPVLILAGEQDPITPPAWGEMLHTSIPDSYFYEFPGVGHAVFPGWEDAGDCAELLVLAFLKDSSKAPDGSCVSTLKPLPFRVPSK